MTPVITRREWGDLILEALSSLKTVKIDKGTKIKDFVTDRVSSI